MNITFNRKITPIRILDETGDHVGDICRAYPDNKNSRFMLRIYSTYWKQSDQLKARGMVGRTIAFRRRLFETKELAITTFGEMS
jgi:hypothetical protein